MYKNSHQIALVSIILASFLWSTAGVVAKILLRSYTPFFLAFIRYALASLFILPFYLGQKHTFSILKKKEMVLIGLLSAGNIAFYYLGLTLTSVNASSIIYTATPLLVALIAYYFLHEYLSRQKIVGIVLGFVGVTLILLLPLWEKGQEIRSNFRGNLLVVLAMICFALYTTVSKRLITQKKYPPLVVTTAALIYTAIIFGFISIVIPQPSYSFEMISLKNVLLIVFLALFVTVVTNLFYQWALKHVSSTTTALTSYLQPVFSIFLAFSLLGEQLSLGQLTGMMLVFLGLGISSGKQSLKAAASLLFPGHET